MKIAFLVAEFPSLSETFILNQITGLRDRGYEVDIYASCPGKDKQIHGDIDTYNLLNRTFYIGNLNQRVPTNKLRRVLKATGLIGTQFHRRPIPIVKSLNVFKFGKEAASLSLFYRVMWFLDMGMAEYDIVHCHFGIRGNFGALLKGLDVIKGKLLTTFYGYDISSQVRQYGKGLYAILFEQADAILAISERMKEQLIQMGCSKQKIFVHRLGVDTGKFQPAPRHRSDNGRVKLLTIARLVEKKGVEYSIRAVAKVLKNYPHIEYDIVGDGPLRTDLEHLIRALAVDSNIKLLGWKKQEAIINVLKNADILLAPSVTAENGDQEGTPTVIIEALARGLPVVSTTHSAIPEVVQHGITGFLVPERDVDGLADRLVYLIENRNIWAEMGQRGRESVLATYDINKLNDRLLVLYKELIAGTSRNGSIAAAVSCAREA
jgi:colanic acid/amylovoran biosynthesis glycosyltransferase